MNRNRIVIIAIAALLVIGVGLWAFNSVLGETEPASGPMTAIPVAAQPTSVPDPTAEPMPVTPAATDQPTMAPVAPTEAPTAPPAETPPNEVIRYQIVADESTVSFRIAEDLRGQRIEAVGTTNQVAGEIAVNPSDLTTAQIGVIRVNARTFTTDSSNRDRAIRNFILNTDQYEFITFTPTGIEGLSGSGALNPSMPVGVKVINSYWSVLRIKLRIARSRLLLSVVNVRAFTRITPICAVLRSLGFTAISPATWFVVPTASIR